MQEKSHQKTANLYQLNDFSIDLIIEKECLSKIEYLCSKIPNVEYSGVLFYKHTGSFENKDLKLYATDVFLMDIGTETYTEWNYDTEVAGYVGENIHLMDHEWGIMHSHNKFSAFFSGTDQSTLLELGEIYNHCLSLIVNNAGQYVARITKKESLYIPQYKKEYNTFNNEKVSAEKTEDLSYTKVYYYDLNIIKENKLNTVDLDNRIKELQSKRVQKFQPTKHVDPHTRSNILFSDTNDMFYIQDSTQDFFTILFNLPNSIYTTYTEFKNRLNTKYFKDFNTKCVEEFGNDEQGVSDFTTLYYSEVQNILDEFEPNIKKALLKEILKVLNTDKNSQYYISYLKVIITSILNEYNDDVHI